jgi:hypothetical protein
MRVTRALAIATLVGFAATSPMGCNQSTDVPLAPAPAVQDVPRVPISKDAKDVKKGGGPSSSGNMNRNPGADT